MKYETVIGLEAHLHLKTRTKAFCGCSTEFGSQPNTQACPVCLGFPGTLPVLNRIAFEYAIKVGLALNCQVQEYTKFDRKHYYYPDLPKNYQISQYDLPISKDGFVEIASSAPAAHPRNDDNPETFRRIGIRRVHLEEDAGKLIHEGDSSLVDYNRAGIPLLEIVSQPEIFSPQEAYEYLTGLKSILEYLDVSDCDMEKGSLRCDANISLRKPQDKELGTKTELKNLNSFKAVRDALSFEVERQTEILEGGREIIQETRLWDEKLQQTISMRSKEEAQDYRYFPEPDLPPFVTAKERIEEIRKSIPELPRQKLARFVRDYGLSGYDAKILTFSKKDAQYAEACMDAYPGKEKKPVVNWLIGPLLYEANSRNTCLSDLKVPQAQLIELVNFVENQQISNLSAKAVLTEMIDTYRTPAEIIKEKNLVQLSDSSALAAIAEEVISENKNSVNDFKAGKENALMFLVGQAMKKTKGRANPKALQEILRRRLKDA